MNIQTTTTKTSIEATTATATLTIPIDVVNSHSDDTLLAYTKTLAGALLATPESKAVSTELESGTLELRAGEAFWETGAQRLHDHIERLVAAVLETYFHVELDAGAPDHYRRVSADGGDR